MTNSTTHTTRVLLGLLGVAGLVTAARIDSVSADGAVHASAVLRDSAGVEIGFAEFTEDATGAVHVNVKVDGLTPGKHGIHIHAVGACTPDFAAAGAHHNPLDALHGSHAGDLPNLEVNEAGQGTLNAATRAVSLSAGPVTAFDTDGSAVIIHAMPDDFVTQPTGNSGGRVACGVITLG